MITIPPGGFAGFSQMTPASQRALFPAKRGGNGGTRRKRSTVKRAVKRTVKRAAKAKAGRLVKGSAAAKRFMANLRKKRRK